MALIVAFSSIISLTHAFFQGGFVRTRYYARSYRNRDPNRYFSLWDDDGTSPPPSSRVENEDGSDGPEKDEISEWIKTLSAWPLQPPKLVNSKNGLKEETKNPAPAGDPALKLQTILSILSQDQPEQNSEIDSAAPDDDNNSSNKKIVSFPGTDQLIANSSTNASTATSALDPSAFPLDLGKWVNSLREGVQEQRNRGSSGLATTTSTGSSSQSAAEIILKQAVARIETLLGEASTAVSAQNINALLSRAARGEIGQIASQIAIDGGLNVTEAASWAMETTVYASKLLQVANSVVRLGYTAADGKTLTASSLPREQQPTLDRPGRIVSDEEDARPLFYNYKSAVQLSKFSQSMKMASVMGFLSGAIYENTQDRLKIIQHSLVAKGYCQNVMWMVTDSIANATDFDSAATENTILLRTITFRGFDASDEQVDREELLNTVCTANPIPLSIGKTKLLVHAGLWSICEALYEDLRDYVYWTAPGHKIVLNGHSVGGSLATLFLYKLMLENEKISRKRVLRVYTFGSPPVVVLPERNPKKTVLERLGLSEDMVHGFVQPWDPIVRLFSSIDSLYPLIGDLGEDGVTPWANGPPRTLRGILRSILIAWDGWPLFREAFQGTGLQNFTSVGQSHILLPDPTRYIADRFFFAAVNIPVPRTESILRVSSKELLDALEECFPLDTFEISLVPQAIRGFVHHFYPAYGYPLVDYVKRIERQQENEDNVAMLFRAMESSFEESGEGSSGDIGAKSGSASGRAPVASLEGTASGWERASQWWQGGSGRMNP